MQWTAELCEYQALCLLAVFDTLDTNDANNISLYRCTPSHTLKLHYFVTCFAISTLTLLTGRASGLQKYGVITYWCGYLSGAKMICIWSSRCHFHPIICCFNKIQKGLSFLYQPTHVVLEKRLLNECCCI